LKLCFVSREFPPDIGGVGRATYLLADALGEAGHDVTVVTGDGPAAAGAFRVLHWSADDRRLLDYWSRRARGARWEAAHTYAMSRLAIDTATRGAKRCGGYDLTEFWMWGAEACGLRRRDRRELGAIAIRLSTPDTEVRSHHGADPRRDLDRQEARGLGAADIVCAISPQVAETVQRLAPFDPSKIRLSPLGLPRRAADGDRDVSPPTVAFVGRLERRKGVDDLLAAIPAVRRSVPDCRFILAGSDSGESEAGGTYLALARALLGPEDLAAVHFEGRVTDERRDDLLQTCTIAVFPSRYESFGLAILEAMSLGAPVVATDVGGVPHVAGENGAILVEAESPDQLAGALVDLLADPAQRASLSARGLDRARQLSTSAMVRQATEAYATVTTA